MSRLAVFFAAMVLLPAFGSQITISKTDVLRPLRNLKKLQSNHQLLQEDDEDQWMAEECMEDNYSTDGNSDACNWDDTTVFCGAVKNDQTCSASDIEASFEEQCAAVFNTPVSLPEDIFDDAYHGRTIFCEDEFCYSLLQENTPDGDVLQNYCDDQCADGDHGGNCIVGFIPADFSCLFTFGSCEVMGDVFDNEADLPFDGVLSDFMDNFCGTNCAGDLEDLAVTYAENCGDIDKVLENFPPSIKDVLPEIPEEIDASVVADMVAEAFDVACSKHNGDYCVEILASVATTVEEADNIVDGVKEWLEDVCPAGGCLEQFSDSMDVMTNLMIEFGGIDVDVNFHLYDGVICVKTDNDAEFCAVEIMQFIIDQIEENDEEDELDIEELPGVIDGLLDKLCDSCFEGYMKAFGGLLDTAIEGLDADIEVALHADLVCARPSNDATTARDFCTTATFEYLLDDANREALEECTEEDGLLIEDCTDNDACLDAVQAMQLVVGRTCVEWSGNYVKETLDMFAAMLRELTDIFLEEFPDDDQEARDTAEEIVDEIEEWSDMVMQSAEMIVNCPTIFATDGTGANDTDGADGMSSEAVTAHVGQFVTILVLSVTLILFK